MAPTLANRQTVREALGTLLSSLVGAGKTAQFGHSYKKATFNGESPGYTLASSGANRSLFGEGRVSPYTDIYVTIHLFALYMTVNETSGAQIWTEQQSENQLDALEKGVNEIIESYRKPLETNNLPWEQMDVFERTVPDEVFVEGWLYRHEEITVRCHCPNPS